MAFPEEKEMLQSNWVIPQPELPIGVLTLKNEKLGFKASEIDPQELYFPRGRFGRRNREQRHPCAWQKVLHDRKKCAAELHLGPPL